MGLQNKPDHLLSLWEDFTKKHVGAQKAVGGLENQAQQILQDAWLLCILYSRFGSQGL